MSRKIALRVWDGAVMQNGGQVCYGNGEVKAENGSVLMQFTGLLDKNGKEIYEGDVVNVVNEDGEEVCTQEVKWGSEGGYWCSDDNGNDYLPPLGSDDLELEIIGNVWENPEFLEV